MEYLTALIIASVQYLTAAYIKKDWHIFRYAGKWDEPTRVFAVFTILVLLIVNAMITAFLLDYGER